ncbi:MAG: hypothetical protein KDA96_14205 [Planctomycetaceae bacterium]|nr:hypothetical protein [Planctomycetaceae bacterium]
MDNASLLVVAMAEKCKRVIQEWDDYDARLPKALHRKHLLWMCEKIVQHAEVGPAHKLHRWIGFIQCAMLANRMLDLDQLKAIFDEAKLAHQEASADLEDMLEHLDPTNSFEFDIGGQG